MDTTQKNIVQRTEQHLRERLAEEPTGHDWYHACRVSRLSILISQREGGDPFIIQLAALLHDIADWKFYDGDETVGPTQARIWLEKLSVSESVTQAVVHIIQTISFKGEGEDIRPELLEGKIVQDADRLDALGAIGIARTFAYGGHKGRELYNPDISPERHETANSYKSSIGPTINHFYEKLLLLKDRMNTTTAQKLAEKRHIFMKGYLEQFTREWHDPEAELNLSR